MPYGDRTILIQCAFGDALPLLDAFEPRHREYCRIHSIDYICLRGHATKENGPFMDRYLLLRSMAAHYDLMVYMDADAVICDINQDLRGVPIGNAWGAFTTDHATGDVLAGVQYWRSNEHVAAIFDHIANGSQNDEVQWNGGIAKAMIDSGDVVTLPDRWHSSVFHGHRLTKYCVIRAVHGYHDHDRLSMLRGELDAYSNLPH